MVIMINSTEDFLRVLRENEEFRIAARRELLTDDLLKLPLEFSEFRTHVDGRFEEVDGRFEEVQENIWGVRRDMDGRFEAVDGRFDAVDERFEAVQEDIQGVRRDMDKRFDAVQEDIRGVGRDVDGLGNSFRREVRAQSSFRGVYAQREGTASSLEIAGLFADWLKIRRIKTNPVSRRTLLAWLESNMVVVESLQLRDRAWRTFLAPDLIAEVRALGSAPDSTPEFYIAVEASYTGEKEDIERATDHAKIVRAVTGLQAYPVVVSVELDDQMDTQTQSRLYGDIERFFEANDEDSAFWYGLDSADLRPEEPR